jgi:Mce-associated membrane protein
MTNPTTARPSNHQEETMSTTAPAATVREDASEETTRSDVDDPGEATGAGRLGRLPRPRRVTVLLAAALVASLVTSGWLFLAKRTADAVDASRSDATAQARTAAVALTSYDYRTLGEDFDAVRELAVDPFAAQFDEASRTLTDVLEKYEGTAEGEVVRAAVSSADEDRVQVLLFVDQTVTSSLQDRPRTDRNRIAMTMVRTDEGWRVSEAELL